jgi:hypothetical protein
MDGIKDVVNVFSNNQQEKDACELMTSMGKAVVDTITMNEWR